MTRRLTLAELRALKPGEKVKVHYAEEGRPPRLEGTFVVEEVTADLILVSDSYGAEEFTWRDWDEVNNHFDDGQGIGSIRLP